MSDADTHALSNPKEAAILKLIQEKIAARLTQLENEHASNDSTIKGFQTEVDGYVEVASRFVEELDKIEAQHKEDAKPNMSIDLSEDHTPTHGGRKVPQTTRENKTGLIGKKPGDTPTNGAKSDKAQSLNEVPEEKKANAGRKPVPASTPKVTNKADKPADKPAVPKPERPGKKPAGDAKKEEGAAEETKTEEEGGVLSKADISALKALKTPAAPVPAILDCVCVILKIAPKQVGAKKAFDHRALLNTTDLNKKINAVDVTKLPKDILKKVREHADPAQFVAEKTESVPAPAAGLFKWVLSILEHAPAPEEKPAEEEKTNAHPEETKTEEPAGVLSKADVSALKALKTPTAPVPAILDCVCVVLKIAPKQVGAKKTFDHRALLNISDLVAKVNAVDVTKLPKDILKKVREHTDATHFVPEKTESVPAPAVGLFKWVLSILEHAPPAEPTPALEEKPAATEKPANEKPAVPKRPVTAAAKKDEKKDEKKEEKKEEKKDEKKPATPAPVKPKTTPAAAGTKPVAKKEEAPAGPEFPELKAALKPLRIADVSGLKSQASPPEPVPKLFSAISTLLHNKDIAWKDVAKTYLADLATLQKSLHVDVPALPQANVDAAKKIIADNKLDEATLKGKNACAGVLFNWLDAAIKLHEKNAAGGTEGQAAAPAEEHKQEEPKEAATPATETKEATPKKAENKEATPEKIPEQKEATPEKPAAAEQKEATPQKVEEPKEATPEKPAAVEQKEATPEKIPEPEPKVEEEPKVEHKEEEQPKAEPEQQQEQPQVNGDHAEPEPAAQQHEEPVANHVAEEQKTNEGEVDNKQVINDLSELLGHNVETEVTDGNVKEYIQGKVREIETQISSATNQNGELRREGVQENPERKPYEVKESTKGFIEMVEPGWVNELLDNQNWDEKIYQVLVLFFLVQGNNNVPDVNDHAAVRAYAAERLRAEEGNIVGYFLGVEKRLEIDTATKIKIQEYVKEKAAILNPNTFDGVDGLCGVISFLMKEISEYLGVIPLENAKKISAKEKIYLLNNEKIEFYNQCENKIIEIAHKHGVVLDS